MANWWSRQYNDIRGNLKWGLLMFLWWLITTFGKNALSLIPHIPQWLVYTILCLVSLVAFFWIAKLIGKSQQVSEPPAPDMESDEPDPKELFLEAMHDKEKYQDQLTLVRFELEQLKAQKPDASVKDSDPQVVIEFRHDLMCFIPVNRGKMNPANFVCFDSIRLREHWISFPEYAYSLVIGRSENLRPQLTRTDGAENHADLYEALFLEYNSFHDPKLHELPVPLVATYQDEYRNLFETRCELVFSPSDFADLRRGKPGAGDRILQIRNSKFKKLAAAI